MDLFQLKVFISLASTLNYKRAAEENHISQPAVSYHIKNLEVIADMDSVRYLNISFTRTSDISGIMDMDLERFSCIGNYVPQEQRDEFAEKHPDSLIVYSGNPYGYAWRYDDYGYHYFSYYARMREV
ncbi:MAG: LysR family transcriptional regulator, partial [Lachnospiraceae bacterium]|nr:LysR family transcriptional regulator [Lachnospiraceae bacterium]